MSIVQRFSKRMAAKKAQMTSIPVDDDDKLINELAAKPKFVLPTGQNYGKEDLSDPHHPWDMYYQYIEHIALPKLEETKEVLSVLGDSMPGEFLPAESDDFDPVVEYKKTVSDLDRIGGFLKSKLPTSAQDIEQQVDIRQRELNEYPLPPRSVDPNAATKRTAPEDWSDVDFKTPSRTDYSDFDFRPHDSTSGSSRLSKKISQLYAERRR